MPTQTIIDSPFATLWYYPDRKIVHHRIHKFIFGKDFRDLLMAGTEVLRKNQAAKWLSDDRSNSVLAKEDVEFGNPLGARPRRLGGSSWPSCSPTGARVTMARSSRNTRQLA